MKILVTGGAGFIGSHIVDRYIKLGHQVLIIDDLSTGKKENINPKAEFYKLNISSTKVIKIIKEQKPQIINHHAAQVDLRKSVSNPTLDAEINILGLLNLMEAAVKAKSVNQIIFASTGGAIYGDAEIIPTPEDYPAWPVSPYGVAKLTSEHYLYYYQSAYNIPFVSLRYGNVYGPRQNPHGEAGVVAILARKIIDEKKLVINGNGKQTRDFVFVSDVVKANELVLKKQIHGIFNIATEKETQINTIFNELAKQINLKIKIVHGPAKKGEQKRSVLSTLKAKKSFGWKADTDLETGIRETVEFFKNQ